MRLVLMAAGVELRRLVRARSSLVAFTVLPVLIAAIAAAGLGTRTQVSVRIAVSAPAPLQAQLLDRAESGRSDTLQLVGFTSPLAARRAVVEGQAGAAVIVSGEGSAETVHINVIRSRWNSIAGDVAERLAGQLRVSIDQPGSIDVGEEVPEVELASTIEPRADNVEVFAHVIAVFFSFLAAGAILARLHDDRASGTLTRAAVAPVRPGGLMLARLAAGFVAAAGELILMIAATSVLLGVAWGDPLALGVLVAGIAAFDVVLAALIVAFTGNAAQATMLLFVVSALLGVLGGGFVPLRDLPELARSLAGYTPVGIATGALARTSANDAGLAAALQSGAAITSYTAGLGAVALVRARRLFDG